MKVITLQVSTSTSFVVLVGQNITMKNEFSNWKEASKKKKKKKKKKAEREKEGTQEQS
jgi:hypothetical protein